MQTIVSIADLLDLIDIERCWSQPLSLRLGQFNSTHPWVQVVCEEGVDTSVAGSALPWRGRKWALSLHMTDAEIVSTVWMAVQAAVLHEVRELFTFSGAAIYDPHHPLNGQVTLALSERDTREEIP